MCAFSCDLLNNTICYKKSDSICLWLKLNDFNKLNTDQVIPSYIKFY